MGYSVISQGMQECFPLDNTYVCCFHCICKFHFMTPFPVPFWTFDSLQHHLQSRPIVSEPVWNMSDLFHQNVTYQNPNQLTRPQRMQYLPLRWRHNGRDSVSNHQPHDCFLNLLFRRRSKKTSKLRVTGLCAWNSPGTGEFPAQMVSNAENVSIWWRHHAITNPSSTGHLFLT